MRQAAIYRLWRGAPYQARLRRFALVGRTNLREEGMTDAEIDAGIDEAVNALAGEESGVPRRRPS